MNLLVVESYKEVSVGRVICTVGFRLMILLQRVGKLW